jgi:predicted nucleic acid-binding protein
MTTFARTRAGLRARGILIPDLDLLIAATALEHDLTLLTRNRRHFDRITGLKLYQAG